jgi:hypothetical protein
MSTKYTHLELGKDIESGIAGYYTPEKEVRLKHNGKEALYVIGIAVVESACNNGACSTGSWIYAIVPGYIINWQKTKNEAGLPVSEVEPIVDEKVQEDIRQIIRSQETASLISFW